MRSSPSNRRSFDDMTAPLAGESDGNRHVDSKPRLGGNSSDEGPMMHDSSSDNDFHSRSPPKGEATRGRSQGGLGGSSSGSENGGERRTDRGASPLSEALGFLYAAASPRRTLQSSTSENNGSGYDGRGWSSSSGSRPAARRTRAAEAAAASADATGSSDQVMSDQAILRKLKTNATSAEANSSSDGAPSDDGNNNAPRPSRRRAAQPQLQPPEGDHHGGLDPRGRDHDPHWGQLADRERSRDKSRDALPGKSHSFDPHSHAHRGDRRFAHRPDSASSTSSASNHRPPPRRHHHHHHRRSERHQRLRPPTYYRDLGDEPETECYSDVEASYRERFAPSLQGGGSSSSEDVQHHRRVAEAKEPLCGTGGDDAKRAKEAKDIAEDALLEKQVEAKQEAPEYANFWADLDVAPPDKKSCDPPLVSDERRSRYWEEDAAEEEDEVDDEEEGSCSSEGASSSNKAREGGSAKRQEGTDADDHRGGGPPGGDFFAPFFVVIRPHPDAQKKGEAASKIRKYGASFALEDEEKRPDSSSVNVHVDVSVVDDLRANAPKGVVILGGRRRPGNASIMSLEEAGALLSLHEDPSPLQQHHQGGAEKTTGGPASSSVADQHHPRGGGGGGGGVGGGAGGANNVVTSFGGSPPDEDDDLEELLAQQTARKPPRRSARPLAPAGVELSAEERVALERERNREHARNTRLRKKAALATLKETVEKLQEKQEKRERAVAATFARGAVKRACVETFFRYRARAERSPHRWAQVVAPDVEVWQPVNPAQSCRPSQIRGTRRVCVGVEALVEDAASLAVAFRSVGRRGPRAAKFDRAPRFVFEATIASRDQSEAAIQDAFATSDVVGMHWSMRTLDAVDFGVKREVSMHGMLVAKFDAATCKVEHVEFLHDVNALATQTMEALGRDSPEVVPRTLADLDKLPPTDAVVVTTAARPHRVTHLNAAWLETCRVPDAQDALGKTLSVIQSDLTDVTRVDELLSHVNKGRCADAVLVNYKFDGAPFLNYLRVFPLYSTPKKKTDPRYDINAEPGCAPGDDSTVGGGGGSPSGSASTTQKDDDDDDDRMRDEGDDDDEEKPVYFAGILHDVQSTLPGDPRSLASLHATPAAIAAARAFRQRQQRPLGGPAARLECNAAPVPPRPRAPPGCGGPPAASPYYVPAVPHGDFPNARPPPRPQPIHYPYAGGYPHPPPVAPPPPHHHVVHPPPPQPLHWYAPPPPPPHGSVPVPMPPPPPHGAHQRHHRARDVRLR